MSHADLTIEGSSTAGATERPAFSVPAKELAMWLFIISDTLTFTGCLVAYGFVRNATDNWPRSFNSITNVAIMTLILLTSSLTMIFAERYAQIGDKTKAFLWTMITAICGIMFAALHIREWIGRIGEGMTLFHNPWGTPLFSSWFFSITGLHLLHVIAGVVALVAVGLRYKGGRYRADDLEITGLYWHFVDLVWMFVVPLIYLMNLAR